MSWLAGRVDAGSGQRLEVALAFGRIDDVHGAVAGGEPLADEGKKDLVELVLGMEERARMAAAADLAAGKIHLAFRYHHYSPRTWYSPAVAKSRGVTAQCR